MVSSTKNTTLETYFQIVRFLILFLEFRLIVVGGSWNERLMTPEGVLDTAIPTSRYPAIPKKLNWNPTQVYDNEKKTLKISIFNQKFLP